jgi:hypothetical protein
MRGLRSFWQSLTDEGQARRLTLLGGAIAFVVTAIWQFNEHRASLRATEADGSAAEGGRWRPFRRALGQRTHFGSVGAWRCQARVAGRCGRRCFR